MAAVETQYVKTTCVMSDRNSCIMGSLTATLTLPSGGHCNTVCAYELVTSCSLSSKLATAR